MDNNVIAASIATDTQNRAMSSAMAMCTLLVWLNLS
jgi:hypothetical protein